MPPDKSFRLEERFILCEGQDDKNFLEALARRSQLSFQVKSSSELSKDSTTGGRPGFIPALAGFHVQSGFDDLRGVLIVTDNDNDKAFKDTQRVLTANGYTPPNTSTELGYINGKPVRILLIPPNQHGDLEALCLPAVLEKWPYAKDCAKTFLACTGASSWSKETKKRKAFLRSIIVGCNEADPYNGLGILFQREILNINHPCLNEVYEVLSRFDNVMQGN